MIGDELRARTKRFAIAFAQGQESRQTIARHVAVVLTRSFTAIFGASRRTVLDKIKRRRLQRQKAAQY